MADTSRVEGCLVREPVEWEVLVRALSEALAINPADIASFNLTYAREPPPPVLVERHERETGFRMDLTLYVRNEVRSELTGVRLAQRLAVALGQDALTSPPPASNGTTPAPDLWILARPDGSLFLVRQLAPESDDVEIDFDPDHMQRLPSQKEP